MVSPTMWHPILAALVVVVQWSGQPPNGGARTAPRRERPNLGIADDTSPQRAMISLRQIRIRNVGHVPGEGYLSIAIIDSVGTCLIEAPLENGHPITLPAASLGGTEGHIVPISGPPAFRKLLDSLVRTESRFGLRASIRTVGGDADDSDNVRTRECGPWAPMGPSATVSMTFSFAVSAPTRAAELHVELIGVPIGSRLGADHNGGRLFLHPGHYTKEVHLRTPKQLPHGSVFGVRLTLTDSVTGETLQQHERFAAYDTVPPMLTSYRGILLRDGRVAIQVQAGDRHSGVSEEGVATRYSLDGGKTWRQQVHSFVEDDFGKPALFETIIGPFAPGADLLIGLRVQDRAGNTTDALPTDASVFLAPSNAEQLLNAFSGPRIDGNPIFAPETIVRLAAWIDTAHAKLFADRPLDAEPRAAADRFELRRLQELREVLTAFRTRNVDLSGFDPVDARVVKLTSDSRAPSTVLHVPAWRR